MLLRYCCCLYSDHSTIPRCFIAAEKNNWETIFDYVRNCAKLCWFVLLKQAAIFNLYFFQKQTKYAGSKVVSSCCREPLLPGYEVAMFYFTFKARNKHYFRYALFLERHKIQNKNVIHKHSTGSVTLLCFSQHSEMNNGKLQKGSNAIN